MFDTAAKAQVSLNNAAADHADALRDFQTGVAKHFLGGADPARTVGSILRSSTAVRDMAELGRLTASDPDARAGLQRAIVDHITEEFTGNAAAGDTGTNKLRSDRFQTFVGKNIQALRQVMEPAQVDTLQKIAADLQRSNKSVEGVRAAGGSDTTQKASLAAKAASPTLMGDLMSKLGTGVLSVAGWLKGGPVGAFIGNRASAIIGSMRAAGIEKTKDLFKVAMLNPVLARVLMVRVTQANASTVGTALVRTLANTAAARGGHVAAKVTNYVLQHAHAGSFDALAALGDRSRENALARIGR